MVIFYFQNSIAASHLGFAYPPSMAGGGALSDLATHPVCLSVCLSHALCDFTVTVDRAQSNCHRREHIV